MVPSPLCFMRTIWRSIVWPGTLIHQGIPCSGHDLREEEVVTNATVTVCRCEECGKYSIAWERNNSIYMREKASPVDTSSSLEI